VIADLPVPRPPVPECVAVWALRLANPHLRYAPEWLTAAHTYRALRHCSWKMLWALTCHERLRLRASIDAVVAALFGLDWEDACWVLRECDRSAEWLATGTNARRLDPKGFWRVDAERDAELRQTILSLAAFHGLCATI